MTSSEELQQRTDDLDATDDEALATFRRDNAGAVTALETDVAAWQADADAILAALGDLDTEAKALFVQLRDVAKRANELNAACQICGVPQVRVALTDAIRNYQKLGAAYRV